MRMKKKLALFALALLLIGTSFSATVYARPPKAVEATIIAAGDIMTMPRQLTTHYDSTSGKYDFSGDYTYIKPYLEAADLSIGNFESTFSSQKIQDAGIPRFSAPDELADGLKYGGFDVLNFANNHVNDFGDAGIHRTLDILKSKGFEVIGMRNSPQDKNYIIQEVNGIKIGLTGYTFESSRDGNGIKTINGHRMTAASSQLLNSYGHSFTQANADEMSKTIQNMKNDGAEFIIFYMHWGKEGTTKLSTEQTRIAQHLANNDVDVIFGMHPHILQSVGMVNSQTSSHKTLVYYSLGNLVSNMGGMHSGLSNTDTMLACIRIMKDSTTGDVIISEAGYLPAENLRTNKWYPIVPVKNADGTIPYPQAYSRIDKVVGASARAVTDIKITEWLTPENYKSKTK